MQEVDCEFPEDEESYIDKDGKHWEGRTYLILDLLLASSDEEGTGNRWRHRFVKEIAGPISEHLCLTRPIKYSEILDFDRRIREFDDPPLAPSLSDPGTIGEFRPRLWALQKELSKSFPFIFLTLTELRFLKRFLLFTEISSREL